MATELLSVSELRSQLLKLIKHVERIPERYIITREGKPAAVLLSYEEFRSLITTLEVVLDSEMVEGIEEGLRNKKAGKVKAFEDVFGEYF